MKKILIVEDDEKLRNEVEIFLKRNGYEVEKITIFQNTIEQILTSEAHLVLLDINLPELDGEYICKEIRKTSEVPIIIVTSRNTEIDELISMNYGADDFVTKPFNTQILLAKIAAILKRSGHTENVSIIDCSSFSIDTAKSMLKFQGQEIDLTKNELRILTYLANKRGAIVSRDEIMTYLWDGEMFVDDNTLTVNMNRLRKKLEDIGLVDVIDTKRGQGYLLNI